jgi:hypothetical protein
VPHESLPPVDPSNYDRGLQVTDRTAGGEGGMDQQPATLGIQFAVGRDDDAEEVAEATLQLRRELLDLDVEAVEQPRAGEPPAGTRGGELAALGTLAVTLSQSQLLAPVVATIRTWLAGQQQRSIKLELDGDILELTGVSSKEQQRLAQEWLRRHESL